MLIDSPRLTDGDRDAWARWETYDALLAADPALGRLQAAALRHITRWRDAGPGICSVSWGKDSTIVAHLTAMTGLPIPIVRVRADPWEMPESDLVRDAFLAAHPGVQYEERQATIRVPMRGQPGYDDRAPGQDILGECVTERYISGVRMEESRTRAMSVRHRGEVTRRTCRPIARWTALHVFAYLHREGLPVHPAYAASCGGRYDRRWLRVHPLCSAPPPMSTIHGLDMALWEDTYWPDITGLTRATPR